MQDEHRHPNSQDSENAPHSYVRERPGENEAERKSPASKPLGKSYASLLKPKQEKSTQEPSQSYEDMFPALGGNPATPMTRVGRGPDQRGTEESLLAKMESFGNESATPMTRVGRGPDQRGTEESLLAKMESFGNESATPMTRVGRGPDQKMESFGNESAQGSWQTQTSNDLSIAEAVQAEEYEQCTYNEVDEETSNYEYELEDIWYDAAVTESLSSAPTASTRPIPAWDDGGDTESPDTEPGDEHLSICEICMDRPKNATLLCGHRFCYLCACQMRVDEHQCAICRRSIITVIKTYN